MRRRTIRHATDTTNLADILERLLDKGIVIAGDIRVKLLDLELLTIQLQLVVCSVDRAREIGLDWWARNPILGREQNEMAFLKERVAVLEGKLVEARRP